MRAIAPAVFLCLASAGLAQAPVIVDIANGPGTNFTSIQSAINGSPAGATILVRPGTYAQFIINKNLSLVGEGAVTVFGISSVPLIGIENLPARTDTVIRGIDIVGVQNLRIENCQGRLLIDSMNGLQLSAGTGNRIVDCAQVLFTNSALRDGTRIERSNVTIVGSFVFGRSDAVLGTPGLVVDDATVVLARTTVAGGGVDVFATGTPGPAIQSTNDSTITITDDGSTEIAAGTAGAFSTGFPASAIEGQGTLHLDPAVTVTSFMGAPAIAGSFVVNTSNIPSLVSLGAPLAGSASVEIESDPGDTYLILVALPGNAIPLPGLQGELWLDPTSLVVAAAGTLDATGRAGFSYFVPALLPVLGTPLSWVGVAGSTTLRLSNNAANSFSG